MAAPNIVDVSTIIGKSATVALSSTSQTTLVSNAASSGKVFKINMIQVANVDGANVTVPNGESAVIYCDGAGSGAAVVNLAATFDLTTFLESANNLSDVADAATARGNLAAAPLASPTFTGTVTIGGVTYPTSDGTNGQALVTDGAGTISFGSAGISTGKAIAMAIVFG